MNTMRFCLTAISIALSMERDLNRRSWVFTPAVSVPMDTKKFTVIVTTRLHWNMLHHPEGEDYKPTFDLLISPFIGFGRH